MSDSGTPPLGEQARAPESNPHIPCSLLQGPGWSERLLQAPAGIRAVWRLLFYLGLGGATVYLVLWIGQSFFPDSVCGAAALWQEMYGELALFLGAALPAFLMARIEQRPIDDYGLPRHHAFGKMFWLGAGWGLAGITVLLIALRGAHVLSFGHLALHGARIFKFAAFWAVYFLLVALFEEFLMRGYTLFTLSQSIGFWPAAALLSCLF